MVKELYDILNYHLGDKNRRGQVQLPSKYSELQSDLGAYVTNLYRSGVISGHKEAIQSINNLEKELAAYNRSLVFDRSGRKKPSRGGTEKLGFAKRWVADEKRSCHFCEKPISLECYEVDGKPDMIMVKCLNDTCGKAYYMYKSEVWRADS